MIPRQVHQLWIPPDGRGDLFPEGLEEIISLWKHYHPEFEFKLWTIESALAALPQEKSELLSELLSVLRFHAMIADVFRLVIVYEFGGYWMDLRIGPRKRWLDHNEDCNLLLAGHFVSEFIPAGSDVLINGFFGAVRGNSFIHQCIDAATLNIRSRKKTTVWEITGPKLLMDVRDKLARLGTPIDARIIHHSLFWDQLVTNNWIGLLSDHWSSREQVEPLYSDDNGLADVTAVWRYKYLKPRPYVTKGCAERFLPQSAHAQLFSQISALLNPTYICDVGCLDCKEALLFAKANPHSRIIAFEPNPENFFRYCLTDEVRTAGIVTQHVAISNKDGLDSLHVPKISASRSEVSTGDMMGMASLFLRPDIPFKQSYPVSLRRIDSFFANVERTDTFCLWVDVEGHSKEVIEGMSGMVGKIMIVKLELENHPYWQGQTLDEDVITLMQQLGFDMVSRSDPKYTQYDAIFVRRDLLSAAVCDLVEASLGRASER